MSGKLVRLVLLAVAAGASVLVACASLPERTNEKSALVVATFKVSGVMKGGNAAAFLLRGEGNRDVISLYESVEGFMFAGNVPLGTYRVATLIVTFPSSEYRGDTDPMATAFTIDEPGVYFLGDYFLGLDAETRLRRSVAHVEQIMVEELKASFGEDPKGWDFDKVRILPEVFAERDFRATAVIRRTAPPPGSQARW